MITRINGAQPGRFAHPEPAVVARGYAAVIEDEENLLRMIGTCRAGVQGRQAANLQRILAHHFGQVQAILALLSSRRKQFPQPRRFQTPAASHPRRTRRGDGDDSPRWPTLSDLLERQMRLLQGMRAWIGASSAAFAGEPLIHEAVQRHEEMIWMLTALINEDRNAGPPPAGSLREVEGHPPPSAAIQAWENEGGRSNGSF